MSADKLHLASRVGFKHLQEHPKLPSITRVDRGVLLERLETISIVPNVVESRINEGGFNMPFL